MQDDKDAGKSKLDRMIEFVQRAKRARGTKKYVGNVRRPEAQSNITVIPDWSQSDIEHVDADLPSVDPARLQNVLSGRLDRTRTVPIGIVGTGDVLVAV